MTVGRVLRFWVLMSFGLPGLVAWLFIVWKENNDLRSVSKF